MGLWEYTNYTNDYFDHLCNVEILEYDMRNAGISLCKEYNLLPNSTLRYLESIDKKEAQIKLGVMQSKDKKLRDSLSEAFVDARKKFFEANELTPDNVLSIKKDAIFVLSRCQHLSFGHIQFVNKNSYSSYYKFDRYEYYYYTNGLDIKGISDEKLEKHRDYMISAIHEFMFLMENVKTDKIIRYVKEFIYLYKTHQLAPEFYRELNSDSLYRMVYKINNKHLAIDSVDSVDEVLINYNFNTYLSPMIDIVLRKG